MHHTERPGDSDSTRTTPQTADLSGGVVATLRDRYRGCLLGGAIGDALGAAVEFLSLDEIRKRFGRQGITSYASAYGGLGRITDDTQMTLFTAEGLLHHELAGPSGERTGAIVATQQAYLRWLWTQGRTAGSSKPPAGKTSRNGWLFSQPDLHHPRAPGNTCLSALRHFERTGEQQNNDSKGCGGVMRVAPVGLLLSVSSGGTGAQADPSEAFALGTALARITHGHVSGYFSAGAFAVMVQALARGESMVSAVAAAKRELARHAGGRETLAALVHAEELAASGAERDDAIAALGGGWVGEEALAIGVYCALVSPSVEAGVIAAVNHDGDSDSTGSIAGNLLGTLHGASSIAERWLEPLELRDVITQVADDLLDCRLEGGEAGGGGRAALRERYPVDH